MRIIPVSLILAPLWAGCGGECPDGFLRDNGGNCVQVGDGGAKGGGGSDAGGGGAGSGPASGGDGGGDGSGSGSSMGALYVYNDSLWDVTDLYVSECGSPSWGSDQLAGMIAPFESWTVTNIPNGCYDLQAWSWDGDVYWERFGVSIQGQFDWTLQ